ncbi:MAG: hypothetical protein Q9170_006309 [Blastenia crenularia]
MTTSRISFDKTSQRATFSFSEELPTSGHALLQINFTGTITDSMTSFYRSRYRPIGEPAKSVPVDNNGDHLMFSTQFEATDARGAFPCFDEPNLKATFDFSIEVADDLTAVSNMPEERVTRSREGFKVVAFERTPIMSTYLLAWAIGDFGYVEDLTQRKYNGKPMPVRIYTTKGLEEQARFGLKNAAQFVDYLSEVVHIPSFGRQRF